ncbi:MAG TPA: hypothetical protein DEA63_03760 [Firmicutes bacterium]|nr:hypothetical protein [Bacillota bacterium]
MGSYCVDGEKESYAASDSIILSALLSIVYAPPFFLPAKLAAAWPHSPKASGKIALLQVFLG